MTIEITKEVVTKLLGVVDAGLSSGVGAPTPGMMCVEAAVCYALGLPHGDDPPCVDPVLRVLKIRLNDFSWSSKAARAKGLRRLAVIQLGSKGVLNQKQFVTKLADLACRTSVTVALRASASIHKDPAHKAALLEAANRCEASPNLGAAEYAKKIARDASAFGYGYAAAASAADAAAYAYAAYAAAPAYAAYAADSAYAAAASAYAAAASAAPAYAAYAADSAYARDKILSDFAEGVVHILIEMNVPGVQWLDLTEVAA